MVTARDFALIKYHKDRVRMERTQKKIDDAWPHRGHITENI